MVAQNPSLPVGAFNFIFLGLEETLGTADATRLVKEANLHEPIPVGSLKTQITPFTQMITDVYGTTGARGLMLCSGRAAFKYLLKQESGSLGFDAPGFRFLPTRSKLKKGLEQLAVWMHRTYGDEIQIESFENKWVFQISDCHDREDHNGSAGICDFITGLLQEFLAWAGGGKFYCVREQSCRASGADCCSFAIDKFPLD